MEEFRKQKPQNESVIRFISPEINKVILRDKSSLYLVNKNNLPIVQIENVLNSGSSYDPAGKEGLAYLAAMLLDEGAGKFSALELNNEFEKMGTSFSISADKDEIHISALTLSEYAERTIELISLVLNEPAFTEADFIREREKLLTRILQIKDNPSLLASGLFNKVLYNNSVYENPLYGSKQSVEGITLDDVKNFYNNNIMLNEFSVIVVGSQSDKNYESLINSSIIHGIDKKAQRELKVTVDAEFSPVIFLNDKANSPQTEIRIGNCTNRRPHPDYFAKHVLNSILGGQFSSRINLNLREDKGYTYGASSSFNYDKLSGEFVVSTSVQSEVTADAIREILKELNNIKKGVTDEELEFSKSYLIKKFPSHFETYSQISSNISTLITHELQENYFENYLDNLLSVQKDDVINAAQKYIMPDKCIILLVGNKRLILEKLKASFNYPVIELNRDGDRIELHQ
ncbi:MAG: insulinase family protein [Melioribacteraceae bacterium]|nr:insulinase family protein [Melioribacteraceae bacterium]